MKNALKITFSKISLAIFFLVWQYFYSFLYYRWSSLSILGQYITAGLGTVDWNNYFIRSFFMIILWIIVALVIFGAIWGVEFINVFNHNRKIRKKYINNSPEDYSHLVKEQSVTFSSHIFSNLYLAGGLVLIIFGMFTFSDIFENVRTQITDIFLMNLLENNVTVDYSSPVYTIMGFLICFFFWYIFSALCIFLFNSSKESAQKEKITTDHYAVSVDVPDPDEE